MRRTLASAIVLILLVGTAAAFAQTQSALTDQQRLLELKAAWVKMQNAASDRDRYRRLHELGLVADSDLASAQTAYQVAQVAYQQRFLELFAATPRLSVVRCVKSYEGESRQSVTVTLRNSSAPALDWRTVGITDEQVPMPDMEKLRSIRDVVASLTDSDGTIISDPYERVVGELAPDGEASVQFRLLKDVDALVVALHYAGRYERFPVYLEKDRSANMVRLQSEQFSQEADLGASATYDLRLECYSGGGSVFALRTLELPDEIGAEFVDPATGARLNQIKFTEGVTSRNLQLRVFLPDVVSGRVTLDRAVPFLVAALDRQQAAALPAGRTLGKAAVAAVRASSVRLELVPRGVGKLEVTAPTLFEQVRQGEPASLEISLHNIGTRRVDNIRLHADAPSDWQVTVTPALTQRLEPGGKVRVAVKLAPPAAVAVGDYPVRLSTEAYADNRRIESHDQSARIHVVAPPNWLGTGLLLTLLLAVVGGLVWWGVRVTRT
jgi:NPCBM-associated, NEW3 domain of alpha-galactosidase